jgi:hypothetical protein
MSKPSGRSSKPAPQYVSSSDYVVFNLDGASARPLRTRAPPNPRPIPSLAPLIGDKRCYGGDTARIRRGQHGGTAGLPGCKWKGEPGISKQGRRTASRLDVSRGGDYREAAVCAVTPLRRAGGSGALWAHHCTRQCAGRCEPRWPTRVSAFQTERRKAR